MGLFDKLKNVFFEEEYVEVEEQPKAPLKEKVTVAKKIEAPEVKKEETPVVRKEETVKEMKIEETKELEKPVKDNDFKFPMNFDDKDFEVEKTMELEKPIREEVKKVVVEDVKPQEEKREYRYQQETYQEQPYQGTAYQKTTYQEPVYQESNPYHEKNENKDSYHGLYEGKENKDKPGFTLSPIISPVYGILNKNYKKDEIVTKKEVRLSQTSTKKADLDLVREKAYGDLAGDISASIEEDVTKEETSESSDEKEDLLYDLNDNDSPVVKTVTVGDAEEYFHDLGLEYNVDYKVEKEETKEKEEGLKKASENKMNVEENKEDEKNLFDLIDSMYEDKE